ncbi:hypothetical protein KC19_2G294600 [Ceratodon purpureus]|uniref:Uncharacterized protein n=1 Tax=Ceratodon purpureus TaxID=3225 RepID=A0A8T0IZJ2_CERPU|nr:hypothetical protein KC19_2G294600 [Ceratodon purpureus]
MNVTRGGDNWGNGREKWNVEGVEPVKREWNGALRVRCRVRTALRGTCRVRRELVVGRGGGGSRARNFDRTQEGWGRNPAHCVYSRRRLSLCALPFAPRPSPSPLPPSGLGTMGPGTHARTQSPVVNVLT